MTSTVLSIYQVDAFADRLFTGNPAAICPLSAWLPDETMQQIAAENNLAETAFFIPENGRYHLRWFTPEVEVDLCGHATLATAHVLFEHLAFPQTKIEFHSRSGLLTVEKKEDQYYLNFPVDHAQIISTLPDWVDYFGVQPLEVLKGKDDYLLIYPDEETIADLKPDFSRLRQLKNCRGFITSAPGTTADFVSRCFYGPAGIDEDPVTGSAHTVMTPYWANKLNKNTLIAQQISKRGGHLHCTLLEDRVLIAGKGKTYLIGQIYL